MKKSLSDVTLIGLDCVDLDRLVLAADICRESFHFGAVKLLSSLPPKKYSNIVPIGQVSSIESYSHFFVSQLHRYITTKHALVIQHDGFILNPAAWTDEFLEYDYIGALWPHLGPDIRVGNGGFSLRSKKIMELASKKFEECDKKGAIDGCHPEDLWICGALRPFLESKGVRFAPEEVAGKFSFEGDWRLWNKWNGQFGFHGGKWHTNISRWAAQNPGYQWNRFTGKVLKK